MTAITAPYAANVADLVTTAHRQVVTVVAHHPSWAADIPLDADRVTVSFDEGRAPRVRLSLTCRVPVDQATLDALDPRAGVRVQVTAGYVRPGQDNDVHPFVDLGLRTRRVARPSNLLTLTAASDEALVVDASAVATTITAATEAAAIVALLAVAITPAPATTVTAPTLAAVAIDPVTDLWDTIDELADRVNADIYDDGLRAFQLTPRPVIGPVAATLEVGRHGTILESSTDLTRDAWFNAVALTYTWTTTTELTTYGPAPTYTPTTTTITVPHLVVGTAQVTTGPYAPAASGVRRFAQARTIPTTQPEANAAAAALLARAVSRGRSFALRAVSALWLRPGATVLVRLPTGELETHLVAGVDFDLAAGSMSLTTRLPDDNLTIGA